MRPFFDLQRTVKSRVVNSVCPVSGVDDPADPSTKVARDTNTTLKSARNAKVFPRVGPSQRLRPREPPGTNSPADADEIRPTSKTLRKVATSAEGGNAAMRGEPGKRGSPPPAGGM